MPMQPIKLFNTLTRTKEDFTPMIPGKVGIYTCGPTVYHDVHIGNLRTFLFEDFLKRMFELNGYEVNHVMNITDVGHLVGDGDVGEDKVAKTAKENGQTAWDVAEHYTKLFLKDVNDLAIEPPTTLCKATDHIKEQIALIQELEAKGFTYKTKDGIYYDTKKFEKYGALGGQKAEDKRGGARVDLGEKHSHTDFALWKFSTKGEKRQMEWESPWGKGFPGWHIECSAMAMKYLGPTFDIHAGGMDLAPVHHENEIAQAEAATDKPFVHYWLHGEFLLLDEKKMSKSVKNIFTLNDLVVNCAEPLAYRLFAMSAHYRSKLNFTYEALRASSNALRGLRATLREWDAPADHGCEEFEKRFIERLNDDLDMPGALAVMWEMVRDEKQPSAAKAKSILMMDRVFGLSLAKFIGAKIEVPETIQVLVDEREKARTNKDWIRSDELRLEIELAGFEIEDTATGPKLRSDH